jgi:hypothetical protein
MKRKKNTTKRRRTPVVRKRRQNSGSAVETLQIIPAAGVILHPDGAVDIVTREQADMLAAGVDGGGTPQIMESGDGGMGGMDTVLINPSRRRRGVGVAKIRF